MIRRDSSCRRDLLWALEHDRSGDDIVARCEALGFDGAAHGSNLWIFSTPGLHQVVVVRGSGRVQLRLTPLLDADARAAAAQALAAAITG